tara:strand:+ start:1520 stop:1741 length:222 start_codon:yes stop_codon:yes gene_type:complete
MDTSWRKEYLGMKVVNKRQRQLLEEGPQSLSQSWLLMAMHNDYKKMKGIKEPPYRESGYQISLKEWFQTYEAK